MSALLVVLGSILTVIWPYVVGGGAAVLGIWLVKYFTEHPESKYAMYWPFVIAAVNYAEKAIPDDTTNSGAAKADAALKEFIRMYQAETGKTPNEAMTAWFNRIKELAVANMAKPTDTK